MNSPLDQAAVGIVGLGYVGLPLVLARIRGYSAYDFQVLSRELREQREQAKEEQVLEQHPKAGS